MDPIRLFSFVLGPGMPEVTVEETPTEYIVRGVAAMTEGPALGHTVQVGEGPGAKTYQVAVDRETVSGLVAGARVFETGVKVKADHGGGVMAVMGYLNNFSEATTAKGLATAKADFHVLKSFPGAAHLVNLIKSLPDTMGFSALFTGPMKKVGDILFARVNRLRSVDFVTDPAANPTGIFAFKVDSLKKLEAEPNSNMDMTPEQFATACAAALKTTLDALTSRIDGLEKRGMPTAQTAAPSAPKADTESMYSEFLERISKDAKVTGLIESAVATKLQDASKTLAALGLKIGEGPAPSAPSAPGRPAPAKDLKDMTFIEVVALEFGNPANKGLRDYEVIRNVALAHPDKHKQAIKDRAINAMPPRTVPFEDPNRVQALAAK